MGGILNIVFPNFIIDVGLFLFLCFVIYKLFTKGFKTYAKESAKMKKEEVKVSELVNTALKREEQRLSQLSR